MLTIPVKKFLQDGDKIIVLLITTTSRMCFTPTSKEIYDH